MKHTFLSQIQAIVPVFVALSVMLSACSISVPHNNAPSNTSTNEPEANLSVEISHIAYGDFLSSRVATPNGLYLLQNIYPACTSLCYIDMQAQQEIFLCSNPNCTHSSANCNAYLPVNDDYQAAIFFMEGQKQMEYCLSILYVAMDELGMIWCMDAFMERRYKDWKFWVTFTISMAVSFYLFNFVVSGITILHTLIAYAMFFIWSYLFFKVTSITLLVLVVLLYGLVSYFISFSVIGASAYLLGISVQNLRQTYFPFIASSIINYLLLLLICSIVKKIHPLKRASSIRWPILFLTFLFPLASFVVLLTLIFTSRNAPDSSSAFLLCGIFLAIANIAVFLLLDWVDSSDEAIKQRLALEQTVQLQAQNMEALGKAYSAQRKITHDFNSQIETIGCLLKNGDSKDAIEFITALQAKQTTRSLLVNTHHPIVDALLNQKAYIAKDKNIQIHFEVNDLSNLQLDSVDITTILGNLLDNAIEASMVYGENSQIQVKVLLGDTLFFAIRNTCKPVKIIGEYIPTTKPNAQLHGFGLENVKTLLHKYNGEYAMEYDEGWFTFTGEIDNIGRNLGGILSTR